VTICASRRIKGIARTLLRGTHYQRLHRNRSYTSHGTHVLLIGAAAPHRQVLLPRMEHQTKRKRRRAFGGCGRWHLIPDSADNRMTPVESIGQGRKRGWSVVCEYLRASQRAQSPAGQQFFFFFNPRTPGGPTSSGSIVAHC
jgi:hypothetical protein